MSGVKNKCITMQHCFSIKLEHRMASYIFMFHRSSTRLLTCLCGSHASIVLCHESPPGICIIYFLADTFCVALLLLSVHHPYPIFIIQIPINRVSTWAATRGFEFSTEKNVTVHFHRKRGLQQEPSLTLNNYRVMFKTSMKFLGLTFDQRLSWKQHIDQFKAECQKKMNLLRCVSAKKWEVIEQQCLHYIEP